jgi:hypothetical protein
MGFGKGVCKKLQKSSMYLATLRLVVSELGDETKGAHPRLLGLPWNEAYRVTDDRSNG